MILPEWTITDLNEKMESGELSSHQVTELYLQRIAAVDKGGPYINSVIELNPDALEIADGLDKERKAGKLRGPLHGIPIPRMADPHVSRDRMRLNLARARQRYGLPHYQAHDALTDAVATAELFLVLRHHLGAKTLRDLR